MEYELGFLGAGNMAEAIARAAIRKGVMRGEQMMAFDPQEARRTVALSLGMIVGGSNEEVIRSCKYVLLAVKPQTVGEVAKDLAKFATPQHVIMTILAGVTTAKLNTAVVAAGGKPLRIVRIMPNTPMQIGLGMAGVSTGAEAKPGDDELAMKLFGAGGEVVRVDESKLDAITAVSGSGPAYVFYLAEAMERAARELGLGDDSRLLVRQTILGAAHLMVESPDTPAELRRKVTSPGGTTEAAIKHMDGNKTTEVFVNALKAAEKRSKELGA